MLNKKVLILDAQLFQSFSIHRGVGKYSLSLIKEMNINFSLYDRKILIFNDSGFDDKDKRKIKKIASNFEFVFLPLKRTWPNSVDNYRHIENENKEALDIFIRDNFDGCSIDFIILSLFQHHECPTFPSLNVRKSLIVYDLIPLLFPELYLNDETTKQTYLSRFKVLYEADHFFTISLTVANDLSLSLGIPKDYITPILGAPVKRKKLKEKAFTSLQQQRFILLPSGDDPRKNNLRSILAFEIFNRKHKNQFKLVITSLFDSSTQEELARHSNSLLFTGNVTEEQLAWLYDKCEMVLFTPFYEGLGMPVLEAVEFNKTVVCSDIDVFKEIDNNAFYFCNPYEVEDIALSMNKAYTNKDNINESKYKSLLKKYTWSKTSDLLLTKLSERSVLKSPKQPKPNIAVFAPTPSGYSAIGKFVQEQHFVFSKFANIEYFLESGISEKARTAHIRENILTHVAVCRDPWLFNDSLKNKYAKTIYHIGNSEYHLSTTIKALSLPDTIVLHDPVIEGLYSVLNAQGLISDERLEAEKNLDTLIHPKEGKFVSSLVSKQRNIIIHSDHAEVAVKESMIEHSNKPLISKIMLTTITPYTIQYRDRGSESLVIGIAGIVHQAKGPEILSKISKIKLPHTAIKLKVFGFSLLDSEAEKKLLEIQNLEIIYSPSDAEFKQNILDCDLIFNFRPDYQGEPSLAVLESLRFGKAVIVNKKGWFQTLPDEIVYKAKTEMDAIKLISEIDYVKDAQLTNTRKDYIEKNHSIQDYIAKLVETL